MKLEHCVYRLDYLIDVEYIKEELVQIAEGRWIEHHYPEFHRRGNDALLLITSKGEQNHDFDEPFLATDAMKYLSETSSLWNYFNIPFLRSRFMRIAPYGNMPVHQDTHSYWNEIVRMHIPIFTSEDAYFMAGREKDTMYVYKMREGEVWLLDNSCFHGVVNSSNTSRVHLVIDVPLSKAKELINDSFDS